MKIGYARVSTEDQKLDLQINALNEAGCKQIFQEKISGAKKKRPELSRMLEMIREGDEVIVYKLDRLGRSLSNLVEIINLLMEKKVKFRTLTDNINIDDESPMGKLMFHIFASFAEYERNINIERTRAGLAAAQLRGVSLGRPKGLSKEAEKKAISAVYYYEKGELSITQICKLLEVSQTTFYRYIRLKGSKDSAKKRANAILMANT